MQKFGAVTKARKSNFIYCVDLGKQKLNNTLGESSYYGLCIMLPISFEVRGMVWETPLQVESKIEFW